MLNNVSLKDDLPNTNIKYIKDLSIDKLNDLFDRIDQNTKGLVLAIVKDTKLLSLDPKILTFSCISYLR